MGLLVWNEGRYIKTLKDIQGTRSEAVPIPCGASIQDINNGTYGVRPGGTAFLQGCKVQQVRGVTDTVFAATAGGPASVMSYTMQVYLYGE